MYSTVAFSIDEIKAANAAAGYHWFETDTMRFFRSRIGGTVYQGVGGVFFISSEQFVRSDGSKAPRRYTVRRFNPATGDISTAGPFNKLTREQAVARAKRLAAIASEGAQ